jgi:hypothetical protein
VTARSARSAAPLLALGTLSMLGALAAAPAHAQTTTDRPTAPATVAAAATPMLPGNEQLPVGFGSLTQNDVAIRLRTPDLEVRVVPLDERVLRLLAGDAYASLHQTVEAHRASIDSIGRQYGAAEPGLMLVSFYGLQQNARFDPSLLTVTARNRLYRPIGLAPLGSAFYNQQLNLRGAATAIYVFEERFPVTEPITVTYGVTSSNDWSNHLPLLERERQRVTSRAQSARPAAATDSTMR